MRYAVTALTFLLQFARQCQLKCTFPSSPAHAYVRNVLEKVLLHQDYLRCSSVDTTYQRLVCEIWDEADETSLRRLTCSTGECIGPYCVSSQRSFTSCPDGSFNKTCLPHDDGEAYTCACQSAKPLDSCLSTYQWDSEWRDITSGRQGLFRQLCDPLTEECVATEYLFGVAHLVKYIPLPDERISASSEQDASHAAKRVRIDNYNVAPCCWAAHISDPADPTPYVQFNFPQIYVVLGILIRARCDPPWDVQRPIKVNIQYSLDDALWNYTTPLDVYPVYGNTLTYAEHEDSFTYLFEKTINGRYWRIIILEYIQRRSMKADIIGKV